MEWNSKISFFGWFAPSQDPLNPDDTVIVIRSLVPGGVAEKDGRVIPGDQLVGVNGIPLVGATLDQAVAALKGAARGPVVIRVAKPVSVLESTAQVSEGPSAAVLKSDTF